MTEHRRARDHTDLVRRYNELIDTVMGNRGGRLYLHGDNGNKVNIAGGAAISSNNYVVDILSAAGKHLKAAHSSGSPVLDRKSTRLNSSHRL